jgi:hypothetical protein
MHRRNEPTRDLLFFLGVYVILVIIVLSMLFSACSRGPQGVQGVQGVPGNTPVVTTLPATSYECPTGGLEVIINNNITVICNGAAGPQGTPGTNPTPVTFVQLCPGFVPSYPSIFPEVGICVNSQLYGVYSANGGFLSLLTPGTYTSDGIGASCTLTILPNCVVQ